MQMQIAAYMMRCRPGIAINLWIDVGATCQQQCEDRHMVLCRGMVKRSRAVVGLMMYILLVHVNEHLVKMYQPCRVDYT